MSATFDRKIHETVSNPQLQLKIYTATGRLIEGRKSSIASDKLPEYQEPQQHVLKADSPEECDAWDFWVEELKSVRELLRNVWTAAGTVPV